MRQETRARGMLRFLSLAALLFLPFTSKALPANKSSTVVPSKVAKKSAPSSAEQSAKNTGSSPAFEAVIVHESESQIQRLMLLSAFEPDSKKIASAEDAERLFKNTQKSISDSQDEGPNIANAANIAKDSAALVGYFLANPGLKDSQLRLKTAAQWLEKYSTAYGEASKKSGQKQKSLYWAALAKVINSDGADGISELIPLRDQLVAEKELVANIDLLVGYSLSISPTTAQQGFGYMTQAGTQISVFGRVGQKLTEAYVEYGLDADGNPTGTEKSGADTKLTYAIQVAKGMPPGIQHLVLNSAIYIWTHSASSRGQKAPNFLTEGFGGIIPVEALREQEALNQLRIQNYPAASALYRTIAGAFSAQDLGIKLDARIWEIELLNFNKNGQITELETLFMSLRERYKDRKKSAEIDVPGLAKFAEDYRKVLDQLLSSALPAQAALTLKNLSIQVSTRYLKLESDRALAQPLKTKLAQLYRSMNNYKEAVELYLDLAKEIPLKNYLLAIEAESNLATWPTQPNFERVAAANPAERTKLLSIYELVSQLKNGEDWFMLAHIGLLHRALGHDKKAEEIWLKSLKTNSNSKLALEAAGHLLTEFNSDKRWEDLIDLSHLMLAKKQIPTLKSKPALFMPWLGDALYNAGTIDLQAQNFMRSVKHFEEFIKLFASDERVASATYSAAFGYKGLNKMMVALNACKTVVEKFPRFPLRPKVMLQAGEWAGADKNTWEYAFYFYKKYILDYKNEKNIPDIRNTLGELYLKRKLYGWAARLYKDQSLASNLSREVQLVAAVKYLDIEEQYGEPKDAYAGAIRITQLAGAKDPSTLHALAFMGRFVANSKDLKGMNDIEPKLLAFSKNSKEVQESIGFVRFRRAEIQTKQIVYTENNLLIKDPEAIIKKYFGIFEAEKQHYLKVCQIGVTTYCAPAMLRLTVVAKQGSDALSKVSIAETLGPNRVNTFKVFKQLHLSKVLQARKEFADQALKLAKGGTTTANWKDEVIKTLEYEDKIEDAH